MWPESIFMLNQLGEIFSLFSELCIRIKKTHYINILLFDLVISFWLSSTKRLNTVFQATKIIQTSRLLKKFFFLILCFLLALWFHLVYA